MASNLQYHVRALKVPGYTGKLAGGLHMYRGVAVLSQEALDEAGLGWKVGEVLAYLYEANQHEEFNDREPAFEVRLVSESTVDRIARLLERDSFVDADPKSASRVRASKVSQ